MSQDITEIKASEITKPKKLAKKAIGLLEAGFGGVLQETISSVLAGFTPSNIPSELAKIAETLGLMTIGGTVKNKHAKALLAGAVAGSAKDLTKMIMSRLNINLSTLKLGGIGGIAGIAGPPVQAHVAGVSEEDLEGY